jgi:trehalose 6-phosphate phosphatase
VKDLMARGQRGVLRDLARTRSILLFDFDGTLAPIVRVPGRARMRPSTRALLHEAALLYPCAVVTGRALGDLRTRVAGLPLWAMLGNHGAENGERRRGQREALRAVGAWRRSLHERLASIDGVWIEDKRFSLTVHFRGAAIARRSMGTVLRAAQSLSGARLVEGHYGINVLPIDAPHKGTAVRALSRRARSESTLYVGDDCSDELVFASREAPDLVTVRVGRSRTSRAAYYLRDQEKIDDLLSALVALRRAEQAVSGPLRSATGPRR